jgi:hypothetical protein
MYFLESEAIANDQPDLGNLVELVDEQLAMIFAPSPLRPADFSCALGADEYHVYAIFESMAQHGLLELTEAVECPECNTLSPADDFTTAISDEDDFECSSCGRTIHRRTPATVLFKMTGKALARAKPVIRNASLDAIAIVAEEPLSGRSQYVLIAMLDLGAIDSDGRRTTAEIAAQALGKQADENALKPVMSDLSTRKLIRTKRGPGGGCWLTEPGIARANKLRRAHS